MIATLVYKWIEGAKRMMMRVVGGREGVFGLVKFENWKINLTSHARKGKLAFVPLQAGIKQPLEYSCLHGPPSTA